MSETMRITDLCRFWDAILLKSFSSDRSDTDGVDFSTPNEFVMVSCALLIGLSHLVARKHFCFFDVVHV